MSGNLALNPLSVGNTVSLGVQIWRSKLRTFLWIAARAYLWFFPTVAVWFIVFYGAIVSTFLGLVPEDDSIPPIVQTLGNFSPILWILTLVLIPVFLYGIAKFLTLSACISRLAYQELSNQPESEKTALSHVNPKLWSFLGLSFLVGLILVMAYVAVVIVASILGAVLIGVVTLLTGASQEPSLLGIFLMVVLGALWIIGVVLLPLTWLLTRLLIAEVPLSVEAQSSVTQSLSRSWQLTQGSFQRLVSVVIVAFVLTIPIQFLIGYLPQIPLEIAARAAGPQSTAYWVIQLVSVILSLFTGAIAGVFILPFWQTIKAVVYFDLRNRREGLGLRLSQTEG